MERKLPLIKKKIILKYQIVINTVEPAKMKFQGTGKTQF